MRAAWFLPAVALAMALGDGAASPIRHLLLLPVAWIAVARGRTPGVAAGLMAGLLQAPMVLPLVEAEGGDEERLRRAGAERRDDMLTVETAAGAIDPAADRTSLAAKEGPDRDEVLAVVQFIGPPKDAWLERLFGR